MAAVRPARVRVEPVPRDSGFTVLELLIVLAITAMAASVVVAGLIMRTETKDVTPDDVQTFFSEAKTSVMRDGRDAVMVLTPGSMSFQDKTLSWDMLQTGMSLLLPVETGGNSIVLFADGTISDPVEIVTAGKSQQMSGVGRSSGMRH